MCDGPSNHTVVISVSSDGRVPLLDVRGSLQLLNSSHVRERDKALLRSIMVGGVWNGFLLRRVRGHDVPCRFCGALDGDGHLFWECTFPPLVEIRENPEFHDLMREEKARWPRCLLWHGWLPQLSGVNCASPWAASADESAACQVEVAIGGYSSGLCTEWGLPPGYDEVEAAFLVPDHTNVWSDGSLVLDQVTGVSSSGAGCLHVRLVNSGVIGGGVMLTVFGRLVLSSAVGVFVRFLGLFNLFRGLSCGVSFLLCSLLELFILVLIIWVLFGMLAGCLLVVVVLFLLNLFMMVIFFC